MKISNRLLSIVALALIILEILLLLGSWLLSATMTEGVRSLLSSEGIRWFFGTFTQQLQSPLLIWTLLLSMAWGMVRASRIHSDFSLFLSSHRKSSASDRRLLSRRQRLGLRVAVVVLIIFVAVIVLLSVVPHAVLLSATGSLWPSPLSNALIPVVAFVTIVVAAVYGLLSHQLTSTQAVFNAMTSGLSSATPLLLIYVLAMQFYQSLRFVWM